MVYVLKMEYVSIYFWPKNDGEKWSKKNIPPCAKPFSDLLIQFVSEDIGLKIQIQ